MGRTPLILDIRRHSLDDGPGIRSVLFFKGCPLRCVWCQNPESLSTEAELQRDPAACIGCRACMVACPGRVAQPALDAEPKDECRVCGACVRACPAAARRVAGEALEVEQILERLLEDEPFYRRSGGGVTLSGGEPTLAGPLAANVAQGLAERGVHVLLETCGLFPWGPFAAQLLPHLSTVYFDLKLADPSAHREHCGAGNTRIHENLARLVAHDTVDVLPRIPLVPGITDTMGNLGRLADLVLGLGLHRMALLPYNPLWLDKRRGLGLSLPYAHDRWMSAERMEACAALVRERGVQVV